MKATIKLLAVFALVLAILSPAPVGAAAEVFTYRGQTVDIYFSYTDASGCIYTGVGIVAGEYMSHNPPGKGEEWSGVVVGVYQYDNCTSTVLFAADGHDQLPEMDLKIAGNLGFATLHTVVKVHDTTTGEDLDVVIDVSMEATGDLVREKVHEKWGYEDCYYNLHHKADTRTARTTGTVMIGSTNYTPGPSDDDTIFSALFGHIYHNCK